MPSDDDSPKSTPAGAGGSDLVRLDPDHPGFRDPVYRARRDTIAHLALDYREGDPPPRVDYTDQEHAVWRTVWENLKPLHEKRAVKSRSKLQPFDLETVAATPYDPTSYQKVLFVAPGFKQMARQVGDWLEEVIAAGKSKAPRPTS